jgi:tocopherol cyclase
MQTIRQQAFKRKLTTLFHPERFQGWGQTKQYFEGWYFKVVNADASRAFAFIPGIAMDQNGQAQAFVQVLDGIKKTAAYHKFPAELFIPSPDRFHVSVGENVFNEKGVQLDLENVKGKLHFTGNVPWPKHILSPGIMGPFTFVPFMECYHGIVSMDHSIEGELCIDGETINMTGGRGYIEKDWGRSFPSAYVWMQSNHFSAPGISIKSSVAKIPWLGSSFVGFICGLWLKDRLVRFTTYNGTKLRKCKVEGDVVEIILENRQHRLEIVAKRDHATALASPILGLMDGRIEESMTSSMDVKLYDVAENKLIFEDQSNHVAIEVAGNIPEILVG